MKKTRTTLILSVVGLAVFVLGVLFFGYRNTTVKNTPDAIALTERLRPEDDFYAAVNYDALSELKIDEAELYDEWSPLTDCAEQIKAEKKQIIDDIAAGRGSYPAGSNEEKLCILFDTLTNVDHAQNRAVLEDCIEDIFAAESIPEYLTAVHETNLAFPGTDILFSLSIGPEGDDFSVLYPCLDAMKFDYGAATWYYSPARVLYEDSAAAELKAADRKLLAACGYSETEIKTLIPAAYGLFEELATFSDPQTEMSAYTPDVLQEEYGNIPFDLVAEEVLALCDGFEKITVADEAQLRCINDCLTEEHLDALKAYALLRILYACGGTAWPECPEIIHDLENRLNGTDEEYDASDAVYDTVFTYFTDTVTREFVRRHELTASKAYYTELVERELDGYRQRLASADWLSEETRAQAVRKLDTMGVYVMYPEASEIRETAYSVEGDSYYEILRSLYCSRCRKMIRDTRQNLLAAQNDWLEVNAFYSPVDNSIYIESGIVCGIHDLLEVDSAAPENSEYEILGSVGYVIGHELSHAFDDYGAKYDEYGRERDWWTAEDKIAFNRRTSRVEAYYEAYAQPGDQTLGENIADLGGYALIVQLARQQDASVQELQCMFEATARLWACQETGFVKGWLLLNDSHSPAKTRVNAVLSSTDAFYDVYGITPEDGMYVAPEERVAVW